MGDKLIGSLSKDLYFRHETEFKGKSEREWNYVLTSFSLLRKCGTLAVESGTAVIFSASLGPASRIGLSPARANFNRARLIGERKNAGGSCSFSVFSLFFFARVRLRSFAKDRWRSGWRLGRVSRWNRRGPAYIPIYPPVLTARIVQGGPPRRSSHREGPLF